MEEEIKYGQLWARHSELVSNSDVGNYRINFDGLKKAVDEALRSNRQGAVWVKASARLPEISKPTKLIIVKRYEGVPDVFSVKAMTAAQLADIVKYDLANFEWLDEGTAAGREEELWEAFENELYEIYRSEGLANAASKAHSQIYLLKVKFKQKEK